MDLTVIVVIKQIQPSEFRALNFGRIAGSWIGSAVHAPPFKTTVYANIGRYLPRLYREQRGISEQKLGFNIGRFLSHALGSKSFQWLAPSCQLETFAQSPIIIALKTAAELTWEAGSCAEISEWLEKLNLVKYADVFVSNEVDISDLPYLSD